MVVSFILGAVSMIGLMPTLGHGLMSRRVGEERLESREAQPLATVGKPAEQRGRERTGRDASKDAWRRLQFFRQIERGVARALSTDDREALVGNAYLRALRDCTRREEDKLLLDTILDVLA
jgi:hypothetical protein